MTTLTRNRETRTISGVCSGLARYIAIDVTWVRLAFILLSLASGLGTALYLVLAVLIPFEEDTSLPLGEIVKNNLNDIVETVERMFEQLYEATGQNRLVALLLILLGAFLLMSQFGWLGYGWVIVSSMILIGGFIIFRRGNNK